MDNAFTIYCPQKDIRGTIALSGSKSISNRVLLIRALTSGHFEIHHLSDSDDTISMENLLLSQAEVLDAHHAGTTFRFLTAYLATKPGTHILTGSERMKQRPVKALVDALNHLGADISYIENEGFPPLKINTPKDTWKNTITLPAHISSQYITALLLIAPTLQQGLQIHLEGDIVSRPYIEMTLGIMKYFGVTSVWENQTIVVPHQPYQARDFHVEADWSAASYFYTIAGLANSADITLHGLHQDSLQGDADIVKIAEKFNLETTYGDHQARICKKKNLTHPSHYEYNFLKVPDITQIISVLCSGLGTHGLFTGLQTLRIKETDRIAALQNEHAKMNVFLSLMPSKFSKKSGVEYYMQEGTSVTSDDNMPVIETYKDHRMAMSFATLGLLFPVVILDPMVVSKSYPKFWKDLVHLGFKVNPENSRIV